MSSRQQPLPYILYHSPCLDGFGSAYAAWRHFGDLARYVPLAHTDTIPELRKGTDLYLLDISFKRSTMLALAKDHTTISVIDHHVTAEAELKDIAAEASNIFVHFDMNHSGAFLSWRAFHPNALVPRLVLNIEDRDLYQHKLLNSREIAAALSTYEQDFEIWHGLMTQSLSYKLLINEGSALLRQQEFYIAELLKQARPACFDTAGDSRCFEGFVVPAVNAPYFLSSDLGHALLEKYPNAPFSAVYRDTGSGRRDWSLRSEDSREDVGAVAKLLGGGGHRNASGIAETRSGEKVLFHGVSYDTLIDR
jgi:oligoribonuclease NrnB/cAMP/cGMP phosphodiesterase (DHH superfamily)